MIRTLIDQLADIAGINPSFGVSNPQINELIARLPIPPPEDLQEYFRKCIAEESYEILLSFHGWERLIAENDGSLLPGLRLFPLGFVCLAQEEDGSQFAYFCKDRRVYHLSEDPEDTLEEILQHAYEKWNSLELFLQDCIQLAKNNLPHE